MGKILVGKYVVINAQDLLWNGTGWGGEYPEIPSFVSVKAAKETMAKHYVKEFTIIADYGYATEQAVYTTKKG